MNTILLQGRPPSPGSQGGGQGECVPPSTCVPMDDGIFFVIVLGFALGMSSLYLKRKKT